MRSHGAPRCELLAQLGLPLGGSSNPRNGLALFLSNSVGDLSYLNVDDLAHGVVLEFFFWLWASWFCAVV